MENNDKEVTTPTESTTQPDSATQSYRATPVQPTEPEATSPVEPTNVPESASTPTPSPVVSHVPAQENTSAETTTPATSPLPMNEPATNAGGTQWMNTAEYAAATPPPALPAHPSKALRAYYILLAISGFLFFISIISSFMASRMPSGEFNVFSALSLLNWGVPLVLIPAGICGVVQNVSKAVRIWGIIILVISALWAVAPVAVFLLFMALLGGRGI